MFEIPDRVSIDLRREEREQEAAEIEYEMTLPAKLDEARECIKDSECLVHILDDRQLAGPLATLMECQEAMVYEIAQLEKENRLDPEKTAAIRTAANAISHIERILMLWQLGEDYDEART